MCRAFRKPSPSHRQGFDPWCMNQPHCFRDQSYARPLSITDILTETHVLHPAEGTSFSHPFGSEQQFLCNSNHTTLMDKQLIELPQLDSPTASLSASLAIKECGQQQQHNGLTNEEYCSDEIRSNNSGQGIDWKSLDNLFASQLTDTANYFSNPNMPLMISHSHELQAQNQASHVLGCFPDS